MKGRYYYKVKLLGYRDGFAYYRSGSDVYRCDYADKHRESLRWFSTLVGFLTFLRAYGYLFDENGEEIKGF